MFLQADEDCTGLASRVSASALGLPRRRGPACREGYDQWLGELFRWASNRPLEASESAVGTRGESRRDYSPQSVREETKVTKVEFHLPGSDNHQALSVLRDAVVGAFQD